MKLLELYRFKELPKDSQQIKAMCLKYTPTAFNQAKKGIVLYRGMSNLQTNTHAMLYNSERHVRKSIGTANFYTLLFDNLPSWANYPKRSRSSICTTDKIYASSYTWSSNNIDDVGSIWVVLPFDDAKIGYSHSADIWHSFSFLRNKYGIYSLKDFNRSIGILLMKVKRFSASSYSELMEGLEEVYAYLKTIDLNTLTPETRKVAMILLSRSSALKSLDFIFNPKHNRIEVCDISTMPKLDNCEFWVQGKVIMIKEPVFDNL